MSLTTRVLRQAALRSRSSALAVGGRVNMMPAATTTSTTMQTRNITDHMRERKDSGDNIISVRNGW